MKIYHLPFIFLITIVLLDGCSSGKNLLQKGNYDAAVSQAVRRLQSKPTSTKAQSVLDNAYAYAINYRKENLFRHEQSNDPFKWENMIGEYQAMNRLSDQIRYCPACLRVIPNPVNYSREISSISDKAAAYRYELGDRAMLEKDKREKAIEAHNHFSKAHELIPNYRDSRTRADQALEYATLRVVIEPIPAPTRGQAIRHEYFYNRMQEHFLRNQVNQYVRFHTPEEAKNGAINWVDHIIRMQFDQYSLGNVITNVNTIDVSRDSVIVGKLEGKDVYGTVTAKVRITERRLEGSGILDFQIIDAATNRVLSQDKFPSAYLWTSSWATFNGDERALTDEQRALVKRGEQQTPMPQFMFEQFAAPLYDQAIRRITQFYRRF